MHRIAWTRPKRTGLGTAAVAAHSQCRKRYATSKKGRGGHARRHVRVRSSSTQNTTRSRRVSFTPPEPGSRIHTRFSIVEKMPPFKTSLRFISGS
eukprot:scaffold29849_cov135-Isochrysis_galbana.AAC.1